MEELDVVMKKLNWKEKIIVRINKKLFKKVCNIARIDIVNNILFSK